MYFLNNILVIDSPFTSDLDRNRRLVGRNAPKQFAELRAPVGQMKAERLDEAGIGKKRVDRA